MIGVYSQRYLSSRLPPRLLRFVVMLFREQGLSYRPSGTRRTLPRSGYTEQPRALALGYA